MHYSKRNTFGLRRIRARKCHPYLVRMADDMSIKFVFEVTARTEKSRFTIHLRKFTDKEIAFATCDLFVLQHPYMLELTNVDGETPRSIFYFDKEKKQFLKTVLCKNEETGERFFSYKREPDTSILHEYIHVIDDIK